jgi:hypothetical protein
MTDIWTDDCSLDGFRRNKYFYGKMMTVSDFEAEQAYMNRKRYLLNRLTIGSGILCGFEDVKVTLDATDSMVQIEFGEAGGVAIDPCGHEIVMPANKKVPVFKDGSTEDLQQLRATEIAANPYLYLVYKESATDPVVAASDPSSCRERCCNTRIVEGFDVIATEKAVPPFSCPAISGSSDIKGAVHTWIDENSPPCSFDPSTKGVNEYGVFLAKIQASGTPITPSVDEAETGKRRRYALADIVTSKLLTCHAGDSDNPHQVHHAQLPDVLGVDQTKTDTTEDKHISNAEAKKWEDHCNATGNPHQTHHEQLLDVLGVDPTSSDTAEDKHVSNAEAKKWEDHASATGNAHQTHHEQLLDILGVDPASSDTTEDKHVSNAEAKKWDSSICGIRPSCNIKSPVIIPDDKNMVLITPGENIRFDFLDEECKETSPLEKRVNGIRINAAAAGGPGGFTGEVQLKKENWARPPGQDVWRQGISIPLPDLEPGKGTYLMEVRHIQTFIEMTGAPGGFYAESLDEFLRTQKNLTIIHRLYYTIKTKTWSILISGVFSAEAAPDTLTLGWWAIPCTMSKSVPAINRPPAGEILRAFPKRGGLSLKALAKTLGVSEADAKEAVKPFIDDGMVKVTGTGAKKTFSLVR